tara:strand:- start:496 stop:3066 length:2571 start_codon:yes stop_codon:yes gene_type:complete
MAYPSSIKLSNIKENWLFQLGFYNGDAQGSGDGGFDAVKQADGNPNLAREALNTTEEGFDVDDESVFQVGDFIKVDNEVMYIHSMVAPDNVLVTRGVKGTTAASHSDNAPIYWHNFLPLAFSDYTDEGTFYHGVITNTPSIRESIDLKKSINKTSNVSITFPDFTYKGALVSQELTVTHKYINRIANVYSVINNGAKTLIASFRISDISLSSDTIKISMVSHRPWDNISIPQTQTTTTNNYFPVVYGDFQGQPSTYNSDLTSTDTEYINNLKFPNTASGVGQSLFPVQVDRYGYYYKCLLPFDFGSNNRFLRYYDEGLDAFIPVVDKHDAESYENGYILKTKWHLKRHFKLKPLGAVSKTFSSIGNMIDGDVDHTSSNGGEEATMNDNESGQTNTLTLDNIFNLQAMDDPPDITSSSDNYGMTIMVRWKMTNFYGVTSNTSGLANNSWAITNNSRYASGTATDSGISDGTTFATNGSADLVNGATGSGNATTIAEQTSSTNGAVTATEFSEYPYDNGLSIRFKRVVSSSVDGSGGVSSNIFSTLTVYDVRVAVTSRIDRYNDTTDASARVKSVKWLYTDSDGLTQGTTGTSGDVIRVQEAHLDLLNRFCGIDVATDPNTNIDGWQSMAAVRGDWKIRWWCHKPKLLKDVLEKAQYEGQFVFRFKQGDFNQPQYIHIDNSPSSVLTLNKNDIGAVSLTTSSPSDIVTKQVINYNVHPAKRTYQSTLTAVNSSSRKNYNIQEKENIENVNLDMLVTTASENAVGDTDPTNDNKNTSFAAYQNALFGDVYLKISFNIINPAKWVNSSLEPIEVGSIIDFNNTNMFPEKPLTNNDWGNLKFIITDTKRSVGKLSIKARSV